MEISSWIAHRSSWSPGKTAIRFEGREITYGQLEQQVGRLAGGMTSELGVQPGDRIAYLGQSSPELLELLFACARMGAILVPLNARMTVEQLRVILANCQPRCILVESLFREHAAGCLEGMARHDNNNIRGDIFWGVWLTGDGNPCKDHKSGPME